MEKVASIETRLGTPFWPAIRKGFERLGSVGLMVCGPGMYSKLVEAGVSKERVVLEENRADREMTLTNQAMTQRVEVLIGFEGRLSKSKRSSRQPRCDLVGGFDFGQDWRHWIRQFPVVGTVGRLRGQRRLASTLSAKLNVGKPVPLPNFGFTPV